MNDLAIRVRGLGKCYRIDVPRAPSREFWALRNLDLDVNRGEVVGIVGANGSGKSTLLKILSRITPPSLGRAEIRGRVGCLLEVGTGFHPELTGRENVFLGGAILGMKRPEIARRMDAILEFAEVGDFLDTPVKRYSSGMRLRLAFAVAAHLEPEILIVDEVLAVGDASFQQRCLGRLNSIAGNERTVLFVSHNLSAVSNLCTRALWLDGGGMVLDGDPREVVARYLEATYRDASDAEIRYESSDSLRDSDARVERVRVLDAQGEPNAHHGLERHFRIEVEFRLRRAFENLSVCLQLRDTAGTIVLASYDTDQEAYEARSTPTRARHEGVYRAVVAVPAPLLNRGDYHPTIMLFEPGRDRVDRVEGPRIHVSDEGSFVTRASQRSRHGVVVVPLEWAVETVPYDDAALREKESQ
jgi:lipopolysaccharide transport system ATP-binding protein